MDGARTYREASVDGYLPCPFCGNTPQRYDETEDGKLNEVVWCNPCDIGFMSFDVPKGSTLIEHWNRRIDGM